VQPATAPDKPRILVVEDDVSTHSALRFLLQRSGAEVTIAATLSAARAAMLDATPDGVVLDLMLPDGNGVELLREIRQRSMPVRVAVTTGVIDPEQLQAVMDLRPDAMLRKPINLTELLKAFF
jgi:DNA-binding response OmpR family regulator